MDLRIQGIKNLHAVQEVNHVILGNNPTQKNKRRKKKYETPDIFQGSEDNLYFSSNNLNDHFEESVGRQDFLYRKIFT